MRIACRPVSYAERKSALIYAPPYIGQLAANGPHGTRNSARINPRSAQPNYLICLYCNSFGLADTLYQVIASGHFEHDNARRTGNFLFLRHQLIILNSLQADVLTWQVRVGSANRFTIGHDTSYATIWSLRTVRHLEYQGSSLSCSPWIRTSEPISRYQRITGADVLGHPVTQDCRLTEVRQ